MTSEHSRRKLVQLCEDKGKACVELQPSSSICILSSLSPGGVIVNTTGGLELLPPSGQICKVQQEHGCTFVGVRRKTKEMQKAKTTFYTFKLQ